MKDIATTNKLLLCIVIPLVLYLLKILSSIFIPLIVALFLAMTLLPMMRALGKKNIPNAISIIIAILILTTLICLMFIALRIGFREIEDVDASFWQEVLLKINSTLIPIIDFWGIGTTSNENSINAILQSKEVTDAMTNAAPKILGAANRSVTMFAMTIFYLLLLLAGTLNVQKIMEDTIFKKRLPSMRAFLAIEKSLFKFIIVKTLISLGTGIFFSIACYAFDIKFPVFWGLMTFALNFIQMIGSVISTAIVSLFAVAQLDPTGSLFAFIIILIGIQVVFGSVLEPIFMGKTFSINTITILVMLMIWGYLWGIPGLILSVPITVVLKTVFSNMPGTKVISRIMS